MAWITAWIPEFWGLDCHCWSLNRHSKQPFWNTHTEIDILPANDLVRCGHTLENHTPMSWANIPLVVWVPYSYVITTNHRKHVIFKQVLQGYKALGNSGQFLSHDNCSYFAWKKWLADWLLHCRTRWHVYLVFFFHSIVLKHYYTLLQLKQI